MPPSEVDRGFNVFLIECVLIPLMGLFEIFPKTQAWEIIIRICVDFSECVFAPPAILDLQL